MRVLGDFDLNQNILQNITLESTENFPAQPKVGSFIFKDKRVLICISISNGIPVWVPLTNELATHIHDQSLASVTWTINHDLNTSATVVNIVDDSNKHIQPDEIEQIYNQTTITFSQAQAGKAILIVGDSFGLNRSTISYSQEYTEASDTWVVSHGLGYEPIIRVFVGNNEVQPLSITHDSVNQATVRFTNPQTGIIRAI